MRRKTKSFIGGLGLGLFLLLLSSFSIYYYYAVHERGILIKQYEMLIKEEASQANLSVMRLLHDVNPNQLLTSEDVEIVEFPGQVDENDLYLTIDDLSELSTKIDLKKGTVLYKSMLVKTVDTPNDVRIIEISNLATQTILEKGHFVDVRISFASGLDYVVLAKKEVKDRILVELESGKQEILTFYLNESEQLRLSSALVDAYLREGTFLYTTIYLHPEIQDTAQLTYPANEDVQNLIATDPNIIERAVVALEQQKRNQLTDSLARIPQMIKREIPTTTFPDETVDSTIDLSDIN